TAQAESDGRKEVSETAYFDTPGHGVEALQIVRGAIVTRQHQLGREADTKRAGVDEAEGHVVIARREPRDRSGPAQRDHRYGAESQVVRTFIARREKAGPADGERPLA